jgi:hypothetical protein
VSYEPAAHEHYGKYLATIIHEAAMDSPVHVRYAMLV